MVTHYISVSSPFDPYLLEVFCIRCYFSHRLVFRLECDTKRLAETSTPGVEIALVTRLIRSPAPRFTLLLRQLLP